jgi:hypothetical protein
MRASRLLVAALALALLALAPTVSSASSGVASSAPTRSASTAEVAPTTQRAALTAKIVKRNGRLVMTGVIRSKQGPIVVQRATSCSRAKGTCNFERYRSTAVDRDGRYAVRVAAPRNGSWAWRATRGTVSSEVWLTCVKRPGESCPLP